MNVSPAEPRFPSVNLATARRACVPLRPPGRLFRGGRTGLSVIAGLLLAAVAGLAADYTSPSLGTKLVDPAELLVENVRILSESALSDGRVLLETAADLRNSSDATWASPSVAVRDVVGGANVERLSSISAYLEPLLPGQLIHPATNLLTLVAAGDLATARSEILAGTVLLIIAETADHQDPGATTNLALEGTRIVAETPLANGWVMIEAAADVRNLSSLLYSNVTVNLINGWGAAGYHTPLHSSTSTNLLAAFSVASGLDSLFVAVHSNDVANVRSNILSGAGLTRSGTELWVFNAPPRGIDAETEDAWRWPGESAGAGQVRLVFTNVTTFLEALHPGDLLVEDPGINRLRTHFVGNTGETDQNVLATYLPFLVSSVSVLSNEVQVVGEQQTLREVVKRATFVADALDAYDRPVRDPYNPTLENTYTQAEQTTRALLAEEIATQFGPRDGRLADLNGLVVLPWHFNATNLSDHLKLSGEMLFRQSGLKLEIKIRDFELQRATARVEAAAVLNLLIEADAGEDTTTKPEDQKSKSLIPEDLLPAVTFNLGGVPVTAQPVLSLKAGVESNLPSRLALPLQSEFSVGMEMGYDRALVNSTNDGFFYQPYTQFVPIRVSDATAFDELAATLGAWVELGVGLKLGLGNEVTSVRAGPTLAVRLENTFSLAPLANPWWELDSGIDVLGRFALEATFLGFDSLQLIDAEASIYHYDLFHRDAGGPLLGGLAKSGARGKQGLDPVLGRNVRWGRLLLPSPSAYGNLDPAFVLHVPNTGDVIVGGGSALARFSAQGDLVWAKRFNAVVEAAAGVMLPDGTFTVVGVNITTLWLGNFTTDGTSNWIVGFKPVGGFTLRQLIRGQNAQGAPEYYLVGHVQRALVTRSDPEVIKFDAAGQVLWAMSYDLPGYDDEAHGGTMTSDGNLVISGGSGYPVTPPTYGTPDPGSILKHGSGFLAKIAGADGALLWAHNYPSQWGFQLDRVLEAPDGTLYAAGGSSKTVLMSRPSTLFARFNPDGTVLDHVLVGDDPDWADELPTGGNTAYDRATGFIWTDEGLWACGETGLGVSSSAWVMGLTAELGVRFYSVIDGPLADSALTLADAGDGLAVLGNTTSSYPWGVGGYPESFLLKLPWEGLMRFHPDSRLDSRFLQPRVYKSSADPEYMMFSSVTIPGIGAQSFATSWGDIPFSPAPVTVDPAAAIAPAAAVTNYATFKLEATNPDPVQDFDTWASYHQLVGPNAEPTADTDEDGLANYLEAYFGRSPWVPETTPVLSITSTISSNNVPLVTVAHERATFARTFPVRLESVETLAFGSNGTNLIQWGSETNLVQNVESSGPSSERIRFSGPQEGPVRFFRLTGTPPSSTRPADSR